MQELEASYRAGLDRYERLRTEVEFAIQAALRREDIEAHTITGRVKTPESFLEKVERRRYERPFEEMPDMVGVRVVVRFLSDLPKVSTLVKELFDVRSEDDRVHGGAETTFGYMSIHYVAALAAGTTGPRYDDLKDLHFEIQARTIVMDAWANVSHYLAYKGESSVPHHLRRDFNALSGLFYVADQHFELFVKQERESEVAAQRIVEAPELQDEPVELNLDTLAAVLHRIYPDRHHFDRSDPGLSDFVEELNDAGFDDAREVERLLRRAHTAMEEDEKTTPGRWSSLMAARLSMAIADETYRALPDWRNYPVPELTDE